MNSLNYQPLVEVTRGQIVESIHYGAIAVITSSGKLVAQYGGADIVTFLRSASKPIQAIPFVEAGGVEEYHLLENELASICASHSGTDDHVAVIHRMQEKIGLKEEDYLCGTHPALHAPTRKRMLQLGEEPTPSRHNCSGKHTGMLAYAKMFGFSIKNYIEPKHPVQQNILTVFSQMCSIPVAEIQIGIDGCSVPVFGIPLRNAALTFARLVDPQGAGLEQQRAGACRSIMDAMLSYPEMVAGPDRFDTDLMKVGGGKIISKVGAEGYQLIGIIPGSSNNLRDGLGIAYKIADGDEAGRAGPLVGLEILRQLGLLSTEQINSLQKYDSRPIKNHSKLIVGEIRPCFQLETMM